MGIIQIVGGAFLILSAIVLIIVTLMQESKQSGLSAMSGSSDSYLSKNRGRSMENKLANITKIVAGIFFIATLALNIIITYVK